MHDLITTMDKVKLTRKHIRSNMFFEHPELAWIVIKQKSNY